MKKIRKCPSDTESKGLTCKEKGCQGKIPMGKSLIAWYCQVLGYCRYCYRMHYPKRPRWKRANYREGIGRPLTWTERRLAEWSGFNPEVWSPEFRREMEDYWSARMRGEVR